MKALYTLTTLALVVAAIPAQAELKYNDLLGEVVNHEVPGARQEVCVVPVRFADGKYKKKDAKNEAELCAMNVGENIAACPKLNSTNPGVLFMKPPKDMSLADFLAKDCEVEGAKKEAKYKLSTSCSYTPSLLAYYHMSRALGGAGNVPVAVVRTMDLNRHLEVLNRGIKQLEDGGKTGKDQDDYLIYQTSLRLRKDLNAKSELLLTEDQTQSFGALQNNPKGEVFYKEFFNNGTDRVEAFKTKNKLYKELTSSSTAISSEWNQANVQKVVQLKDMSDMIVMDTILGQQDRFGNVHYKSKYLYMTTKDGKPELSDEDENDKDKIPPELVEKAVLVKTILMKDNDCGVAKENRIKAGKLLDAVAHMDPKIYKRVQKLAAHGDANKELFVRGMLFTETDYRKVMGNLKEAADLLKSRCESGKLKLDLNLEDTFSGVGPTKECGI